jgi:hypothetical protein
MAIKTVAIDEAEARVQERKRQRLLAFINRGGPVWRKQDHPDVAEVGTAEWTQGPRCGPDTRPMACGREQ